ncbi:MAG TPA: DUF4199 domain-containing protein [Saprospiraceae bacterium]|nr:DUF4199 domain-containing protein [Saprospiraceae bacterium]
MFQRALLAGAYAAAVGAVISLIFYVTGLDKMMLESQALSWLNRLILLGVTFYFIYKGVEAHRDRDLGGYISVGKAVGLGTLAGLVNGLLSAIWIYIFMNFVAPEMLDTIKEVAMRQMEEQGQSEEQIEQSMKIASSFFSAGFMSIITLFFSLILGVISGLISGLALKRDQQYR